ncbi:related to mitochondrial ATP synthase epsilon chain domain-containing protein [Cephalotrichum gorgonifer]|uniref:Related to mitochondrial ATP synthase epsilon chain domain-containing protein n=1 Tax=Cephalotrichum gorgonifer TaxID=2041049 RepID=A0AAE8MZE2_9PEZI|nr:related to mitochondrial ATP synthase epsilon chain domain-containing protein [Cephalotrichum gorgonifer]
MSFAWKAAGITYNRYLAVAARAVRRSLKEGKGPAPRAEAEIKISKWSNGKQGDALTPTEAVAALRAEAGAAKSS